MSTRATFPLPYMVGTHNETFCQNLYSSCISVQVPLIQAPIIISILSFLNQQNLTSFLAVDIFIQSLPVISSFRMLAAHIQQFVCWSTLQKIWAPKRRRIYEMTLILILETSNFELIRHLNAQSLHHPYTAWISTFWKQWTPCHVSPSYQYVRKVHITMSKTSVPFSYQQKCWPASLSITICGTVHPS